MPYTFPDWIGADDRRAIENEIARAIARCDKAGDFAICVRYHGEPSGMTGGIMCPDTRRIEKYDTRGIMGPPRKRPRVELVNDFGVDWSCTYREKLGRVCIGPKVYQRRK